jgi:chromosome partitioning protein
MHVIAIANQKGGVGKTTLTRELSACCALRGYQVLAVDCDPQGNLTASWVEPGIYEATLAQVLIEPDATADGRRQDPLSLDDTIVESPVQGLDIIPADIRLAKFELQRDYMALRLRSQLREFGSTYDLVFIDCPPQLGKLLTAALCAATCVLVPCAADAMGLQGLADLAYTIRQIRRDANPELGMLGAIINLYKPARNLSAESRAAVEDAVEHVGYVFDTNIHDYSKIAEAPSQKLPAVMYAPNHRAADQLHSLTDEVLERLKMPRQKIAAVK